MAYTNRYIAIPAPIPTDREGVITVETQLWMVRDTDDKRTLLGEYSKVNAEKLARRLNADIHLSPGERRALDLVASCYPVECSLPSIARAFKDSMVVDDVKVGKRIVDLLVSHGLVEATNTPHQNGWLLSGAKLTEWGKSWLGK